MASKQRKSLHFLFNFFFNFTQRWFTNFIRQAANSDWRKKSFPLRAYTRGFCCASIANFSLDRSFQLPPHKAWKTPNKETLKMFSWIDKNCEFPFLIVLFSFFFISKCLIIFLVFLHILASFAYALLVHVRLNISKNFLRVYERSVNN